jgi:hypothetical protein
MRDQIKQLGELGPLPDDRATDDEKLLKQEKLLGSIKAPVTDDEARVLVTLFGPDDCFGMAWTLLHLVETAPGWPLVDALVNLDNQWIKRLRDSAIRAGRLN